MAELLNKAQMLSILKDLGAAFPARLTEDAMLRRAEVYHEALVGFTGDALKFAAKRSVQEDDYFPKARRLRELAQQYVSYENKIRGDTPVFSDDPLRCRGCGDESRYEKRHRPVHSLLGEVANLETGERANYNSWLVTADGQYLLLETYERLFCSCSTPRFVALPDVYAKTTAGYLAVMPVKLVGFHMPYRRTTAAIEQAA